MARPTKYNEEMQARANDYLDNYGKESGLNSVVPTIAELSLVLDVSDSTFYLWRDKYDEFSRTLDRIMKTQEVGLVNKSLRNEINPTIAKLMMHNHDYSDRVEKDINLSGGMKNDNEVIVTIIDGGETSECED